MPSRKRRGLRPAATHIHFAARVAHVPWKSEKVCRKLQHILSAEWEPPTLGPKFGARPTQCVKCLAQLLAENVWLLHCWRTWLCLHRKSCGGAYAMILIIFEGKFLDFKDEFLIFPPPPRPRGSAAVDTARDGQSTERHRPTTSVAPALGSTLGSAGT